MPKERQFVGMDGYRKAIDSLEPGSVVLLATPPAFRPIHLEYAVQKGIHVFMEKSFAVDAPGVRRVLKAGEEAAKKNLKIAGGLMSRHYKPLEEAVQQIHDGAIGEVVTCWAYREHGPVGFTPKAAGMSELAHQIRNYSNFTWLNGSFLLDWLIHNLDVCCWVKNAWPVSAKGKAGVRSAPSPISCSTIIPWSTPLPTARGCMAQGRHMAGCWGFFGDVIHGSKGSAILGEGQPQPRLYKGWKQTPENLIWQYKGQPCNHYQRRARPAVRGHPPGQALQRDRALRQGGDDRHSRPHGRRVGQDDHLGRGDGLESRTGAGPGSDDDGFAPAGEARRPRPLSRRHAGRDERALWSRSSQSVPPTAYASRPAVDSLRRAISRHRVQRLSHGVCSAQTKLLTACHSLLPPHPRDRSGGTYTSS